MLRMLQPLIGKYPMHVFASDCELARVQGLKLTRIPLPQRPVLLRMVLYSLLSSCAHLFFRSEGGLRIGNDGQFPFCDICYHHFCYRYFLRHHRDSIATTWLRRVARTLTYCWYALHEPIALRHARRIVVPSQGMARELASTYPALPQGKIQVIANPVDTGHFERPIGFRSEQILDSLAIPRDAFVLSFCALASFTRKGLAVLLEALGQLRDPRMHLIVVGGAPGEIREFANVSNRLSLTHNVHFVGLQKNIRPYLWASNVFVFPSAYETFSLVCFQAAAAGLPLIVTRLNGVEDFLVDGVNGWMVERSAESVAAAIRDAAASTDKAQLMGRRAQQDARAYDTSIFQARWLELLDKEFGIRVSGEMAFAAN